MKKLASPELSRKPDKNLISHSELKRLLHYDPETGVWKWLVRIAPRPRIGVPLKATNGGYVPIVIYGVPYQGHVLAWFYMTGEWPPTIVDHRNNRRSDNRWENLRLATKAQNATNSKVNKRNTTGLKGVQRAGNRFKARIGNKSNRKTLGSFDCPAAAHFAYLIEADRRYGEFARAR